MMTPEEAAREARRLIETLPPRHALDYYAVLGTVKGLLILLGYTRDEAEVAAVAKLGHCKPKRRTRWSTPDV